MDKDMDTEGSPDSSNQTGTAAADLAENTPQCPRAVGGLPPEVWAALFRQEQHLLDPVLPWLHQRLVGIYWDQWWLVESAESSILLGLCLHGPSEEALVPRLQNFLQEHTGPLVRSIIRVIECWCSDRALALLPSRAARDEEDSPGATSSSSSSSSSSSHGP